tara:strand:- start:392 stop:1027 length:636 start_codon:yes stop_codon:yes gene_type:complete
MELSLFFIAFITGFIASFPITGPVSMMILKKTLEGKYPQGIEISLGAALTEIFYCAIGISVVGILVGQTSEIKITLGIMSSFLLLFMGIYFLKYKVKKSEISGIKDFHKTNKKKNFFTGVLLIGLNPTIIFTWSAISALLVGLNLATFRTMNEIILFAVSAGIGIFAGSLAIIFVILKNKRFFSEKIIKNLFKLFGLILISLSFYGLYKLV